MIDQEDIDDDYFTPASSTSLANIFGKTRSEDKTDNETLKYTPPKPALSPKTEESKASQCVYACALLGYEWSNGAYIARGKLGFAIIKNLKTGIHNIVLYDSNKTTISCATIKSSFEVNLKENVYFMYLDNQHRYWSLNAPEGETEKISNLLKSLNVTVKYTTKEDKSPLEQSKDGTGSAMLKQHCSVDKESDTDSSINRRTKMSILNRMASMGQSVLPPRAASAEKTSDSSDTAETNHHKIVRHKLAKSGMKRNSSDRNISECQGLVESDRVLSTSIEHSTQSCNSVPLFTYVNGQLLPVTKSNLISSGSSTDMSFFISEQRINNSELRINMNRVTDKVDQIFNKISIIEKENSTPNLLQLEILQKLLLEYENKIKLYEDYLRSKGLEKDLGIHLISSSTSQEHLKQDSQLNMLRNKILELEQKCNEKETNISDMKAEIKMLQTKYDIDVGTERKTKEKLLENIQNLQD